MDAQLRLRAIPLFRVVMRSAVGATLLLRVVPLHSDLPSLFSYWAFSGTYFPFTACPITLPFLSNTSAEAPAGGAVGLGCAAGFRGVAPAVLPCGVTLGVTAPFPSV